MGDVKAAIALMDKSAERTTPNAQTQAWATIRAHIEALEAERDKLRELCRCAYQMAGSHDAPVAWLDALGDAANGTPLAEWRVQGGLGDVLLPYCPDDSATKEGGRD